MDVAVRLIMDWSGFAITGNILLGNGGMSRGEMMGQVIHFHLSSYALSISYLVI